MKYLFSLIIAYVLGSTTLAIFIGSVFFNRDVRNEGSGNMGATNVSRSFGLSSGIITLAWDMGKCALSLLIGKALGGDTGICIAGIGCILGHCYPCFHDFKGGKGVAVGAVIAFFISWKVGVTVIAVFIVFALLSKRVSLGSCLGALMLCVSSVIFFSGAAKTVLGIFTGLLVIYRHRANISRLIHGEEPAFHFK